MTPKPGRELDALVAEKVMGLAFVKLTLNKGEVYAKEILALTRNGKPYLIHGPLMHGMVYPEVPEYSTQIWAAWEVLDRFTGDGKFPMVRYDGIRPPGKPRWTAALGSYRGDADTAPHAICLAALRAVK